MTRLLGRHSKRYESNESEPFFLTDLASALFMWKTPFSSSLCFREESNKHKVLREFKCLIPKVRIFHRQYVKHQEWGILT